jgi:pyrroloquinoline quinone (PQQ) biosynthesis protein C
LTFHGIFRKVFLSPFFTYFNNGREDPVDVQPRLLDHPFYKAWMAGEVSPAALSSYHSSYHEFISRVPGYWQRVIEAFQGDFQGTHPIVEEERRHILLWEQWGSRLAPPREFPRLTTLLGSLDTMNPSRLLGALQAYEVQQPEVAATKKEGLIRHYGFSASDLTYFDEHQKEEAHIAYGRRLAERFADTREVDEGFAEGAELVYRSLDCFTSN